MVNYRICFIYLICYFGNNLDILVGTQKENDFLFGILKFYSIFGYPYDPKTRNPISVIPA
ncbi:MAG: hypothetical protein JWP81_388 [Ferruginibacter sp.]|nr:hypothetical protein [Ferruginibacter sp.]